MAKENSTMLSSGNCMPIFGLGMWQTDSEEDVRIAMEAAIDAGYRHIDTATSYDNEEWIGAELERVFSSGRLKREDLFIVSKLPPNGMQPQAVEEFLKASLSKLKLDYLDLYLVHFPIATKRTDDDKDTYPVKDGDVLLDEVDVLDTWKAMEALVDKGMTKSIGLSNFNAAQVQRICDAARIQPSNLQVECHVYLPQFELFDFCQKLDISVTAFAPLGTPGLPGFAKKTYGVDFKPEVLLEDATVKTLSEKYKKTSAQILLRYLVQRGITVIPKSRNPQRIRENIEVFDFSIDEEDFKILKSMGRNYRYFLFNQFKSIANHPEYPFNVPF